MERQSGAMKNDHGRESMRVATLNCGTLTGRVNDTYEAMDHEKIDVLALQEVRKSETAVPSLQQAARRRALRLVCGTTRFGRAARTRRWEEWPFSPNGP